MLKPQKKISKREIKEDRLVTSYFEFREWIEGHQKVATYAVVIPLVLIAAGILWAQKRADWNEKATTDVARILPYYENGQYDLAVNGVPQEGINGLQSIVDENGSTVAGQSATFYLANSYFALRDYDKAMAAFKSVSVSDKFLTSSALAGIAACYAAKGDAASAAEYYEKAATRNMIEAQAPENLQRAAESYAAAGKKDKAVELLHMLKREFPNSPFSRDVERYIAEYHS